MDDLARLVQIGEQVLVEAPSRSLALKLTTKPFCIGLPACDVVPFDVTPLLPGQDGVRGGRSVPVAMANEVAERLIGTLRRECLDQLVVFGEAHQRVFLLRIRPIVIGRVAHLALGKMRQRIGTVIAVPVLSGLHHQYVRI